MLSSRRASQCAQCSFFFFFKQKTAPEIVGHIAGGGNLRTGHIAAEMDVADLDDLHAIESGRQIVNGNFDAADLVVEALGSKTIHGTEKWGGAGSGGGGAEEVTAAWISNSLGQLWR